MNIFEFSHTGKKT